MSKGICACFAVAAILVCSSFASAAQPSASKMSQMGLSGAKVVSDSVAMEVRGMAYARARASASAKGLVVVGGKAAQVNASIATKHVAVGISASKASAHLIIKGSVSARGSSYAAAR